MGAGASSGSANLGASGGSVVSGTTSILSTSNTADLNFKDKEKKYLDKIKSLKLENKKLHNLLEDSEKLFYGKLQETKKES